MKIISNTPKKPDRWDQLLEKTIHHKTDDGFAKTEDFAFFDDCEDKVFMDGEKLVVVSDSRKHSQDPLKQIFDKEFKHEETKLIQKPPRKSLENRRPSNQNSSNYSSRSSMRFDD